MKLRSQIQGQFVRHWIHLDHIRLQVVHGNLTIRGLVELLPSRIAEGDELTADTLSKIDGALRSLRNLKMIRWRLDNWRYDGGAFKEAE